jgi:hypothetical protein
MTYNCCHGPTDERRLQTTAEVKKPGTRISKKDHGANMKRGCKAHFIVHRLVPTYGDTLAIYYMPTAHTNHPDSNLSQVSTV